MADVKPSPIPDEALALLREQATASGYDTAPIQGAVILAIIARLDAAEAALRPFALLNLMHDDPALPDTTGMIFPGSKAAVVIGDLRRAARHLEMEDADA